MSFGFWDKNKFIDDAIDRAATAGKLLFAAASSGGGNQGRSRPARHSDVLLIHACDGKGNMGDMSPSPVKNDINLTTLGVAVESEWKSKEFYKSGTSIATPVAAAFAANTLEFANFKLEKNDRRSIRKRHGMLKIFEKAMSAPREDYDYMYPRHLWDGKKDGGEVAKTIHDILADL